MVKVKKKGLFGSRFNKDGRRKAYENINSIKETCMSPTEKQKKFFFLKLQGMWIGNAKNRKQRTGRLFRLQKNDESYRKYRIAKNCLQQTKQFVGHEPTCTQGLVNSVEECTVEGDNTLEKTVITKYTTDNQEKDGEPCQTNHRSIMKNCSAWVGTRASPYPL